MKAVKLGTVSSHLIEYLNMTHVGERMKLLNCVSQHMEALAKILASAQRAVSKYRANVPDHLSDHCKMAAGSGLGTRLPVNRSLCSSDRTALSLAAGLAQTSSPICLHMP